MPKTNITTHRDMSALDNDTLDRIILHEREAFGYKGYGEYAFCTNSECRRIQSIDEIYGVADTPKAYKPLAELEADGCKVPDCPDCKSPSQLIFDPNIFRPYLAGLYRGAYGSLILDENDAVQGACAIQSYNLHDLFSESVDYKESFEWPEFRDRTSEVLGLELGEDSPVIATNRLSISRPYRDGGAFINLGSAALDVKPENDDMPAFAAVRYDGKVLPILEAVGYRKIVEDSFGTVTIGIDVVGKLRKAFGLGPKAFSEQFGPEIIKAVRNNKGKSVPDEGPKHYVGMSLVDELQERFENKERKAEVLEGSEMSLALISEISDCFRELYANSYGQYVFYPSDGNPISPQEFFKTEDYVGLEQLDGLVLDEHKSDSGEKPEFWHSPVVVEDNFEKLRRSGHLAMCRNPKTNEIEAFTFGYQTSLADAFENEEWEDPQAYSSAEGPMLRKFNDFLKAINANSPEALTENDEVYVWNNFAVMPKAQRRGRIRLVAGKLAEQLQQIADLPKFGLLESMPDTPAHNIFKKAGAIDVPDALGQYEEGGSHLMLFKLKDFIDYFLGEEEKR